ncbi:MAG TPA: hypothetical protein VH988_12870 [Thermoanaerobaculia bacterium]|nr:hypothetical protein [Thermoanaerobaculia bacterium]
MAPRPTWVRFLAAAALAVLLAGASAAAVPIPEGRPALRFFGSEQGLPQNTPLAFAVDARGLLWAGTYDGAAFYDGRSWTAVNMPNRTESNTVHDILFTPDGDAWFATTGVARLHDGRWTLFGPGTGLPAGEVFRLAAESDGARTVLWAGTERGLARWDGTSWTMVTIAGSAGLPGQRVTALLTVRTEKGPVLWAGTDHGPARRGPDGRWSAFPAIPFSPVVDLLETREAGRSILWAATDGGGLARYDGERWTMETGLPSPRVLCLAALDNGGKSEIWAGTAQGLARRRTGGTWTVYTAENAGLPVDQISRLFAGRSGGRSLLWIGLSTGGLGVLDPGGWQILDHRSSGLPRSPVFGLAETGPAGDPIYWFSTQNRGLVRWREGGGPSSPKAPRSPTPRSTSPCPRARRKTPFGWGPRAASSVGRTESGRRSALGLRLAGLGGPRGAREPDARRHRPLGGDPHRALPLRRGTVHAVHAGEFTSSGPPGLLPPGDPRSRGEGAVDWHPRRRPCALERLAVDPVQHPHLAAPQRLDQHPPRDAVGSAALPLDRHQRRRRPPRSQ